MYSNFPKKDERKHVYSLAGAWTFITASGVGGFFLTPVTVVTELGSIIPKIGSAGLILAGIIGLLAVLFRRWGYEAVAAYFALSGLIAYSTNVWVLTFTGSPSRLQQASLITALIFFLIFRIVSFSAHSAKRRREHEEAEKVAQELEEENPEP